jgi:RNA ligase (TIGR02306 family)
MSSLIVEVCNIDKVVPHKGADKLEVVIIKGWENIVKIGQFKVGDKVVFIPPDSLVPRSLAEKWGVDRYLAGKPDAPKLRVKTVKLRNEMSYGLVVPVEDSSWEVGKDMAVYYEISKYEAPVRGGINGGDAAPDDILFTRLSDIENIRNVPDTFTKGQIVAITEKVDGSAASCGISQKTFHLLRDTYQDFIEQECYPLNDINDLNNENWDFAIWKARSHNVNRKRPATIEEIKKNAYWFPYADDNIYSMVEYLFFEEKYTSIQLWGEVLGAGISGGSKSLHYGLKGEYQFFAYALKLNEKKISFKRFLEYCKQFNIKHVPLISVMEYDFDKIVELSKGDSILATENGVKHIREGVVACAYDDESNAIAKFINPEYLLLKESGKIEDHTDA